MAVGKEETFARAWIIFLERIRAKNSWGKNELERVALDCVLQAAAEKLQIPVREVDA